MAGEQNCLQDAKALFEDKTLHYKIMNPAEINLFLNAQPSQRASNFILVTIDSCVEIFVVSKHNLLLNFSENLQSFRLCYNKKKYEVNHGHNNCVPF